MNKEAINSPQYFAKKDKRDYITSQDINNSIAAGYDKVCLWRDVLEAISDGGCEDVKLSAWVAVGYKAI